MKDKYGKVIVTEAMPLGCAFLVSDPLFHLETLNTFCEFKVRVYFKSGKAANEFSEKLRLAHEKLQDKMEILLIKKDSLVITE